MPATTTVPPTRASATACANAVGAFAVTSSNISECARGSSQRGHRILDADVHHEIGAEGLRCPCSLRRSDRSITVMEARPGLSSPDERRESSHPRTEHSDDVTVRGSRGVSRPSGSPPLED